ncbi:PspC family transcriptional regulator [Bacteroidia bacterium]|nr:PspC family transcriptional regulator [Bacteroidia bacterium]
MKRLNISETNKNEEQMKKTLTVNLGGTVFHIDEDAYQLLEKYLSNLRIHFRKEDGADEIMSDFELRISEIFGERVTLGYSVITIVEVENVIQRMGKVEDLFENEYREENRSATEQPGASSHARERGERRLYRNPDDKILGGVCSGLAAYMGWDPTPVRLLLFLLVFVWAVSIPIYIVLWLVVPLARTAPEKLQMRGESITIENIGRTVTDGFEKLSSKVNEYAASEKPRTLVQKFADITVETIGVIVKLAGILVGIILFPGLLVLLVVLFVIIISLLVGGLSGGFAWLSQLMPWADWSSFNIIPAWGLAAMGISCILLIGIPVVSILYGILRVIFNYKPLSNAVKWALVILWLIAMVGAIFLSIRYGLTVWNGNHYHYGVFFR